MSFHCYLLPFVYKEEVHESQSQRTKGSELILLVKNSENFFFFPFHCCLPFGYKEELHENVIIFDWLIFISGSVI